MWATLETMDTTGRRAAKDVPAAIREAALELFVRVGYENASVSDIVAAAGVTKGAMYHYFRSKNDLLFDIYDRLLADQQERLERIAAGAEPPVERVRAAMADLITTSLAALQEAVVFFRSRHLLPPEQQAEVARRRREYEQLFRALVAEAVEDGSLRPDIPDAVVGGVFFGAVHYLGDWYDPTGAIAPEKLADGYVDLILSGLLRRP